MDIDKKVRDVLQALEPLLHEKGNKKKQKKSKKAAGSCLKWQA